MVAKDVYTLRLHRTHKDVHIETNPPVEVEVPYDANVSFRLEDKPTDATIALKPGNWVQIHEPRPQMIALWNADTTYDPAEQQPVEQGKRGLANDLTCRAVLGKVVTKTPDKVLDLSAQVTCDRWLKGKKETVTLNAKKNSFVLAGKLAPPSSPPWRDARPCSAITSRKKFPTNFWFAHMMTESVDTSSP